MTKFTPTFSIIPARKATRIWRDLLPIVTLPLVAIFFMTQLLINTPTASAATNCATQTDIPQTECEALIDLYNATNGPNWTDAATNNWNVTDTPCTDWIGITCSGDGHITEIIRNQRELSGTLPSTIENLPSLQKLNLYTNQLTGNIPDEVGNLAALEILHLQSNQFTGTIPSNLGNLSAVEALNLNNNQLTGGIPTSLGNLSSVQVLNLSSNPLMGSIPDELGNLSTLSYLYLSSSQLTGTIPTTFANLSNLRALKLSNNQLTGTIPSSLGTLSHLETLLLTDNQLTGEIPSALGNLTNLYQLDLYGNQLNGAIPSTLGNLSTLSALYLNNNQLTGEIPTALGDLSNLDNLYLDNNRLTGTIPSELGNLSNLARLDLSSNYLTGDIPASLLQLAENSDIYVYYNGLNPYDNGPYIAGMDTQTIAPTIQNAVRLSVTSTQVNWEPIPYTQDGGYYQVSYSLNAGGPYTKAATTTADKATGSYTVTSLLPNQTYHFVVQAYTPAHSQNKNAITSTFSSEIVALDYVYLPFITKPIPRILQHLMEPVAAIPIRPATPNETFYTTPMALNSATLPEGGRFYFSGASDNAQEAWVDDLLVVVKNNSDIFSYTFGTNTDINPALVQIPRSVMEEIAAGGATLEYRDVYGINVGASEVWLIWVP